MRTAEGTNELDQFEFLGCQLFLGSLHFRFGFGQFLLELREDLRALVDLCGKRCGEFCFGGCGGHGQVKTYGRHTMAGSPMVKSPDTKLFGSLHYKSWFHGKLRQTCETS